MMNRIEEIELEIIRYQGILDRSYGRWYSSSSYMKDGKWCKSGKDYIDDLKAELKSLKE